MCLIFAYFEDGKMKMRKQERRKEGRQEGRKKGKN
jgi:hypothetical protein